MLALLMLLLAFICPSCARGADAAALVVPDMIVNRELTRALERIAEDGHRACPGGTWCDCRHGGRRA
jgi:hypothetical protein